MKRVKIFKADGTEAFFDPLKLRTSLERSGASEGCRDMIVRHVSKELRPGMSTQQIYRHAYRLLKKCEMGGAMRYSLKQALLQLGPSGYPFERFVGHLWEARGYAVQVGQIVQGRYVKHEVDVIAKKPGEVHMMECKYHNQWGAKSGLKVALYVDARMKDLAARCDKLEKYDCEHITGWLITNTKLSEDAIQYGEGAGLRMMGWSYPKHGNLQELIEALNLHPITVLTRLNKEQKEQLLLRDIVACSQVDKKALRTIHLNAKDRDKVLEEVRSLCEGIHPGIHRGL